MDFCEDQVEHLRKKNIRNSTIQENIKVEKILIDDIKIKQLKWFCHVQKMEENRYQKCLKVASPLEKGRTREILEEWNTRRHKRKRSIA